MVIHQLPVRTVWILGEKVCNTLLSLQFACSFYDTACFIVTILAKFSNISNLTYTKLSEEQAKNIKHKSQGGSYGGMLDPEDSNLFFN